MKAKTIDEVILALDEILAQCIAQKSALGFFTALYRRVTIRIKLGIDNNEFENNTRMEKLDVIFANRFIDAFQNYKAQKSVTNAWAVCFKNENNSNLLILQQMFAGMNAHINLDLGIASSQTMENIELEELEKDFNTINQILGDLVDHVQNQISVVSPLFWIIDKWGKNFDEKLAAFSINIARDGAWKFANDYHINPDKNAFTVERDQKIALLGANLLQPAGKFFQLLIKIIRLFETKDQVKIIQILSS